MKRTFAMGLIWFCTLSVLWKRQQNSYFYSFLQLFSYIKGVIKTSTFLSLRAKIKQALLLQFSLLEEYCRYPM